jgi:hypothetical protein
MGQGLGQGGQAVVEHVDAGASHVLRVELRRRRREVDLVQRFFGRFGRG